MKIKMQQIKTTKRQQKLGSIYISNKMCARNAECDTVTFKATLLHITPTLIFAFLTERFDVSESNEDVKMLHMCHLVVNACQHCCEVHKVML